MDYRVLKIWPFWPKGMKYHDQYLAETMKEDGVSTVFAYPDFIEPSYQGFIVGDEGGQVADHRFIGLKYFSLFGKPVPYEVFWFAEEIRKIQPDVIHIFGISNFTTLFALISARFADFDGKILFNDHSDPNERKPGFMAVMYRLLFRMIYNVFIRNKFDIIVPDDSARDELVSRYGMSIAKKVKIFPLGYDSNVFNYRPDLRKNGLPLVIGFAGKIFPAKRLELLIEILSEFPKNSIVLNIAGLNAGLPSDYQASLIRFAESRGVVNVFFQKFIPSPSQLALFYSAIDVAVFPGSISITTFEANGCGCPVVVFESIDGLKNRVSHNRGKLFRTRDQLVTVLGGYLEAKANSQIDHAAIAFDSRQYSWQRLKNFYYREYDFQIESTNA